MESPIAVDQARGMLVVAAAVPERNWSFPAGNDLERAATREFAHRHLGEGLQSRSTPGPQALDDHDFGTEVLLALVVAHERANRLGDLPLAVHVPPEQPGDALGPRLGILAYTPRQIERQLQRLIAAATLPVGIHGWIDIRLLDVDRKVLEESEVDQAVAYEFEPPLRLLLPPADDLDSHVTQYLAAQGDPPGRENPDGPEDVAEWASSSTQAPALVPTFLDRSDPKTYTLNTAAGVYVGTYRPADQLLTLQEERSRAAAYDLLDEQGIAPVRPPAGWENITGFADGLLNVCPVDNRPRYPHPSSGRRTPEPVWHIHRNLAGVASEDLPVIGEYEPSTGILVHYTREHEQPLYALLARHGLPVTMTIWTRPSYLAAAFNVITPVRTCAGVDTGTPLNLHPRHQGVLPPHMEDLLRVTWTESPPVDPNAYDDDIYEYSGENVTFDGCRMCSPEPQPAGLVCTVCAKHLDVGRVHDTGIDGPWTEATLTALVRLVEIEFHTLPKKEDLGRPPKTDPEHEAEAFLLRLLIPRRAAVLARPHRPALSFTQWLSRAGLLNSGERRGRSIWSTAADGHVCRSLLERRIDDFLHHHGIAHTLEPTYPRHPRLNPDGGSRADWLLQDGTYVEAWGMLANAQYKAKAARKIELADATGLRLVTIEPHELDDLDTKFAPWLTPE